MINHQMHMACRKIIFKIGKKNTEQGFICQRTVNQPQGKTFCWSLLCSVNLDSESLLMIEDSAFTDGCPILSMLLF